MKLYIVLLVLALSSCSKTNHFSELQGNRCNSVGEQILPESSGAHQNFQNIAPGLYVGKAKNKNGELLHLAYEKIDESNKDFWCFYHRKSTLLARYFRAMAEAFHSGRKSPFVYGGREQQVVATLLGYDQAHYDSVINYLESSDKVNLLKYRVSYFESLFTDVKGGLDGFSFVPLLGKFSRDVKEHYVVYASNKVIKQKNLNEKYFENKSFSENFGHILMSVGVYIYQSAPVVTHYGIQRNIEHFLTPIMPYPGISLILHGFSAAVSKQIYEDKKYMSTNTVGKMGEILKSKLDARQIFVDEFPSELQDLINQEKWRLAAMGNEKITVSLEELKKLYIPFID
ncbi:MAG: hypothetical protein KC505_06610 [Myxococcales bacterium]|nr:hypothetical protein [Myxococcales bacterium]USN50744.1 MAG: hypothetical protein H6731_10885 [Myxococcales bacterium]